VVADSVLAASALVSMENLSTVFPTAGCGV
jgi:hypothetical protein